MKTLFLIRHAKSSWDNPGQNDFDRTLNARGLKDAPVMAQRLLERKVSVDLFISSPAKRAKKTCELFMHEMRIDEKQIVLKSELYLAEPPVFFDVIKQINSSINNAAVF
jgi:phosphohistidine phosphatase